MNWKEPKAGYDGVISVARQQVTGVIRVFPVSRYLLRTSLKTKGPRVEDGHSTTTLARGLLQLNANIMGTIMIATHMKTFVALLMGTAGLLALDARPSMADPHCRACPYSCADLGLGHKDCSPVSNARGLCCLDLTERGLQLAREQERVLGTAAGMAAAVAPLAAVEKEHCPAGFHPSEQKCSPEERRRGCKDIRLSGGLGCVKR